jgi:anti-sigma regulatory factor (Ser/Thr protein kinase)
MFITLVAARLDQRTAALDYASAGHTEVLWCRAQRGTCERLPATGPPIGVLREYATDERSIYLCPDDVLVIYSDGVTEAENEQGEFFGTDRLIELLQASKSGPATTIAQAIVSAVEGFSKAPRSDDQTIIVVKALPRTVTFRCPGDLEHVEESMALIRTLGQAYAGHFAYDLELAASEIVTNIVQHSYRDFGGELRGEVRLEADRVQLDLYDDGLPFDISAVPLRDVQHTSERGYGVHIVRQLVDEVQYSPATGMGNHWRLIKTRRGGAPGDGR